MNIYIQSRGRHDRLITLHQLPRAIRERTILVVNEKERDLYESWSPGVPIVTHDKDNLSDIREWILWELAKYERKICLLDDDLRFFHRTYDQQIPTYEPGHRDERNIKPDGSAKFPQLTKNESVDMMRMFTQVEHLLKKYPFATVSPREGNNRLDGGGYPVVENKRAHRFLAYDAGWLRNENIHFDRVRTMQDFDVHLQILRRGFASGMTIRYAQDQYGSNDRGGCSEYRTKELQAESAHRMAELHPGYVKVVEKAGKGDYGKRTDVRISWAKAYKEADLA